MIIQPLLGWQSRMLSCPNAAYLEYEKRMTIIIIHYSHILHFMSHIEIYTQMRREKKEAIT